MTQYSIWNRTDKINGVDASYILNKVPFKNYNGDIILIYAEDGKVTNIECKDILAQVYNINVNLGLEAFMQEYIAKITEQEIDNQPLEENSGS